MLRQFGEQIGDFGEELGEAVEDGGMLPSLCGHVVCVIITSLSANVAASRLWSNALVHCAGSDVSPTLIDASLSEYAEGVN